MYRAEAHTIRAENVAVNTGNIEIMRVDAWQVRGKIVHTREHGGKGVGARAGLASDQ